jgi:murein DD-endopeptidase MepM/ murein hydrolase activator NlpD
VKKSTAIIGALTAAVALFCGLPLFAAVLGDTPAKAACSTPAGNNGRVQISDHAGAVGRWSSRQVDNAAIIVATGQKQRVPPRGWVIAVATAMTESGLSNLGDLGARNDHDSLGLFQQRPSQGWGQPPQLMDPVYASTKFYQALQRVHGWETLPLTVAAQRVQKSAFPDRYAQHEQDAEQVVAAVTGKATITDLAGASLAQCGLPPVVASGGWIAPVHAAITSGFRTPSRPTHEGDDLGAKRDTVIRAAAAGQVVFAGCDPDTGNCDTDGDLSTPGCGWYVEIYHGAGVATRYCHMVRRPDVAVGAHVDAADPVGLVGASGHVTGPHLHFEVHTGVTCPPKGRCRLSSANATDPAAFMRAKGAPLGQ